MSTKELIGKMRLYHSADTFAKLGEQAADAIEQHEASMLNARALLLRWCNDGMTSAEVDALEVESLAFCGVST